MPMTTEQIRTRLLELVAEIDASRHGDTRVRVVRPGDNLQSLIAASDGQSTFALSPDFMHVSAVLDIVKPCTLRTDQPLGHMGRATTNMPGPQLRVGTVRVTAEDVLLHGLRVAGTDHDGAIVQAALRTTLRQCLLDGESQGVRRGVLANAANVTLDRCAVINCHHVEDAQAVVGWDGTRDLQMVDCLFEASGENVMFGGGDPADESRTPQDIVMAGCTLQKPLSWRGHGCITSDIAVFEGEAPANGAAFSLDEVPGVAVVFEKAKGRECARSRRFFPEEEMEGEVSKRDAQALRERAAAGI